MTDSMDREPEGRPPPGAPGHVTSIEDPEETRLNRVITRPMLTFFILGDILGAGIYALTGQVAADPGRAPSGRRACSRSCSPWSPPSPTWSW
jgi:hypothetical protein